MLIKKNMTERAKQFNILLSDVAIVRVALVPRAFSLSPVGADLDRL
jgi:hypothetical protein